MWNGQGLTIESFQLAEGFVHIMMGVGISSGVYVHKTEVFGILESSISTRIVLY